MANLQDLLGLRERAKHGLAGAAAGLLLSVCPSPAVAAERIAVSYKELIDLEIPVSDLESFVQNGILPPSIKGFAGLVSPQQFEAARELLSRQLDIEATVVSQFFSLPEGELVLNRVAKLLQEDPDRDAVGLLREALFRAASGNQGLTLLSAVQQFPAETLAIDLESLLRLVAENAELYGNRETIFVDLWPGVPLALNPSPDRDLRQHGPQRWQRREIRFQTPNRPKRSVADLYLPRRDRPLPPPSPNAAGAPADSIPVVVISHGLGSNRKTFAYLAQHLASHGFAAVVLEHSDTNSDRFSQVLNGLADPPPPSDLINRPRDITAALDHLEALAQQDPQLAQLELNAVGAIGQSLGGYTVLAAGGATINKPRLERNCSRNITEAFTLNLSLPIQCRILDLPRELDLTVRDQRVQAVLAINPLTSQVFGPDGLGRLQIPVMLVSGSEDYFAPALVEQVEPFGWISARDKYLLLARGGTHFSFLDNTEKDSFFLPEGLIGPEPTKARSVLQASALAFLKRHLLDNPDADTYLSSTYLKSITPLPFEFALVRSVAQP